MSTNDLSPEWHDVASRNQLDPDFPLGVEINGRAVGLFLLDDQVHALEDICPHAYAHLSQGFQEDGQIECPLHAARFDIASGRCLNEIGQRDLRCYPVKVENGRVAIRIPIMESQGRPKIPTCTPSVGPSQGGAGGSVGVAA